MSFFDSFIAGAATAGVGIIDQQQKRADEERIAKMRAELELQKADALEKMREQTNIRQEHRTKAAALEEEDRRLSPEYLKKVADAKNTAAGYEIEGKTGLIGPATDLATKTYEAEAPLREKKRQELLSEYRLKTQAELEAEVAKMNDPAYLAGRRKVTQATHTDDGAGLRALQLSVLQDTIAEKKENKLLMTEYETTKDPKREAELRKSLVLRGVLKGDGGEFSTEKVTTEQMNPDGTTTKTEHTQKRKGEHGSGAAAPDLVVGAQAKDKEGNLREFTGGDPKKEESWKPVKKAETADPKKAEAAAVKAGFDGDKPAKPDSWYDRPERKNQGKQPPSAERVAAARADVDAAQAKLDALPKPDGKNLMATDQALRNARLNELNQAKKKLESLID